MYSIDYLGHYIHGAFEFSKKKNSWTTVQRGFSKKNQDKSSYKVHISPADFDDEIFILPTKNSAPIDFVFEKGNEAYLPWTKLPLKDRVKKLLPLKQILKKEWPQLSEMISRETGKPLWESEGEVKALIGKIDFVLGPGLDRITEKTIPQAQGQIRFKSRGLFVVIGPFNFPLHLPFGQILPALVSGNTVLFKPSEKTPPRDKNWQNVFINSNCLPECFKCFKGEQNFPKKSAGTKRELAFFLQAPLKWVRKLKRL